jgi:hypothetical protein
MLFGRSGGCGQHLTVLKFLDTAATHAHKMVVVAMVVPRQLEASSPFGDLQFLQQAHAAQQPQGAIHRGKGHLLPPCPQLLMGFLRAEVAALLQPLKEPQHELSLGGEPLAPVAKAGSKAQADLFYAIRSELAHAEGISSEGGGGGSGGELEESPLGTAVAEKHSLTSLQCGDVRGLAVAKMSAVAERCFFSQTAAEEGVVQVLSAS